MDMEKIESRDEEQNGSFNCWNDEITCVICMNAIIINVSVTDTCLHRFCFECLKRWSLNHTNCPLCRQQYSNIRYNIKSKTEFNQISINDIRLESAETLSEEFSNSQTYRSLYSTLTRDIDFDDYLTIDPGFPTEQFGSLNSTYTSWFPSSTPLSSSSPLSVRSQISSIQYFQYSSPTSVSPTTTSPFSCDTIANIQFEENIFCDSDPFEYLTHGSRNSHSLPLPLPNEIMDYFAELRLFYYNHNQE